MNKFVEKLEQIQSKEVNINNNVKLPLAEPPPKYPVTNRNKKEIHKKDKTERRERPKKDTLQQTEKHTTTNKRL